MPETLDEGLYGVERHPCTPADVDHFELANGDELVGLAPSEPQRPGRLFDREQQNDALAYAPSVPTGSFDADLDDPFLVAAHGSHAHGSVPFWQAAQRIMSGATRAASIQAVISARSKRMMLPSLM